MPQQKKGPETPSPRVPIVWTILMIALLFVFITQFTQGLPGSNGESPTQTDSLITSDFIAAVDDGRVQEVTYDAGSDAMTGVYYPAATVGGSVTDAYNTAFSTLNSAIAQSSTSDGLPIDQKIETQTLENKNLGDERNFKSTWVGQDTLNELMAAHPEIPYNVKMRSSAIALLLSYLPMILVAGFFIFMFYQMSKANNSQMSFGRTKAKMTTEERPDVKFSDVAGVDEAVEEMQEIKDFLANPAKYQEIGAKIPRGCLLVGPPGTGKTLLARAVAGEAGVPFFSISGSDFVEMFVGVGASRVRDLFKQAKEAAPSIIFIDEIDAVGRQRGTGLGGGHDEREQTLNQLLVEMDGFAVSDSVVLIAATNRADVLDPALLRPGRFDRQITVDVPDVKGRLKILRVHAANKPLAQNVDLEKIASLTPGFAGADLANLLNESALLTARRGKKVISMDEVTESMERVIAGPERKGRVMNEQTKRIIAYHESGHALVGHTLEHADPVHKISIISRGRALGYTLSLPSEDKVLNSTREMYDELAVLMGGRVAEEIYCDDITTGASNDLERATKIARAMVTQYGMSADLGMQIFGQPNHEVFLGRDYGNTQDYSEETARRIDEEIASIMKQAHDRAYQVLSTHREQMDLMASVLLERETVDGEACQALLDNRWSEYVAHEQSEEGRAQRELEATTVASMADPAHDSAVLEPVVPSARMEGRGNDGGADQQSRMSAHAKAPEDAEEQPPAATDAPPAPPSGYAPNEER
jgi:cell division protease FtsH